MRTAACASKKSAQSLCAVIIFFTAWFVLFASICLSQEKQSAPDSSNTPAYCIQVIVLSSREAAETYAAELRRKGYDTTIAPLQKQDGGTLYRVRIGLFATEHEARRFGLAFSEKEKKPHVVVRLHDQPFPQPSPQQQPAMPKPPPQDNATLEDIPDETDLPVESLAQPQPAAGTTVPQEMPPAVPPAPSDKKSKEADALDAGSPAVIKIFAFRQPNGSLKITNNYFSIPDELRKNIEYISIYPVEFLSCDASGSHIFCLVDGTEKPLRLAGVSLPSGKQSALVGTYFSQQLKKAPVRIRYNPWQTTSDGKLIARLYTREGLLINLELLKNGIGRFCADTVPPEMQEAFRKAEQQARNEKRGVWAPP